MSSFSPFGRSQLIRRSPTPQSTSPRPCVENPSDDTATSEMPAEVVPTSEIQKWVTTIDALLGEVCSIAAESKLNSEQKLRVTNLCRKVTSGTSHMAVIYQSLKQKTIQAHNAIQHLQDKQVITETLENIKEVVKGRCSPAEKNSFADMVKKSSNNFVRPNNFSSVMIYPTDKNKTSDDTKALIQTIISPEEMKLHVRGVRKIKNGGVVISTQTKDDIDKLKSSSQLMSSGLTIEEGARRRPRIVVIGIPTALSEKEVFDCIFEQNLALKFPDKTRESFLASIKLSHKSGKKNTPTCNYIIEVPAGIRKALINQGRVFINWTSCPVRDFTLVTRCYNCQQYGHAAKFCRETSPNCGHCGETGHTMKECDKKTSPPTCATCKRFKKPSDHQTGDESCPARKYAEDRYINSIDYDGA